MVFFLCKLMIHLNLDSKHRSPRNCPSTSVSSPGCSLPKSNQLQCAVHLPSVSDHVSPLLPTADLTQAPVARLLPRGTARVTSVIMILRSSSPTPSPIIPVWAFRQWFSTFLMLQPFNRVPHVVMVRHQPWNYFLYHFIIAVLLPLRVVM